MPRIQTEDLETGLQKNLNVDRLADSCPLCHQGIDPRFLTAYSNSDKLEASYMCPLADCTSLFIVRYQMWRGPNSIFKYSESVPFEPVTTKFDEHISSVSPMFCTIFDEARNVELQGWKLIAGPGYRKALEFLMKDYLCKLKPDKAKDIKAQQLGPCINLYVDNTNVREMAKRAAWLGNDETHYERKWEDHDLEDLKKVLQLTMHWISMEELTESVLKKMPKGK
jgi:hypothetical protein